jgi:nitroreductase
VKSREQALENFRFFGAPHLAVITTHSLLGARALLDCGGYVALFMLAAHSHGVACVPQASIAYRADVLHEQLGIPVDYHVVCGISFGIADPTHPANAFRTSRALVSDVVTFRGEQEEESAKTSNTESPRTDNHSATES